MPHFKFNKDDIRSFILGFMKPFIRLVKCLSSLVFVIKGLMLLKGLLAFMSFVQNLEMMGFDEFTSLVSLLETALIQHFIEWFFQRFDLKVDFLIKNDWERFWGKLPHLHEPSLVSE